MIVVVVVVVLALAVVWLVIGGWEDEKDVGIISSGDLMECY